MPLSLHFSACGAPEQITVISHFAIPLPFTTSHFCNAPWWMKIADNAQRWPVTYIDATGSLHFHADFPENGSASCFIKGISVTWLFCFKNFICQFAGFLKNIFKKTISLIFVLIAWFHFRCVVSVKHSAKTTKHILIHFNGSRVLQIILVPPFFFLLVVVML